MNKVFIIDGADRERAKKVMDNFLEYARSLYRHGTFKIEIGPYIKNASSKQKAYLFSLIKDIADVSGEDSEIVKIQLLVETGLLLNIKVNGVPLILPKSISNLKSSEISLLIDKAKEVYENITGRKPYENEFS